ncbi:DUF1501 domain-containing protein [Oligoflexaceae bacterium]|nr:DUF1501 domain-containing protein [Oligoflexaceae bacterium]
MGNSRRKFLKQSSAFAVLPVFAASPKPLLAADGPPHFFIHLVLAGGMDPIYAFDARPLEFTDRGLFSNYTYKNVEAMPTLPDASPLEVIGSDRKGTLRSPLTNPIMKYRDQFSVFNGLHFKSDVHELNMPNLFFGNNAGGSNFVAGIGANLPGVLDCVNIGNVGTLPSFGSNFSNSVAMPVGKDLFGNSLKSAPVPTADLPSVEQILSTYTKYSSGMGTFSSGVQSAANGLKRVPELMDKFQSLAGKIAANAAANAAAAVASGAAAGTANTVNHQMIDNGLLFLQTGVTGAVNLIFDYDQDQELTLDAHSMVKARKQTQTFTKIFGEIEHLFKRLNETYYDQAKTMRMMDLTTVLITTEMGRTRKSLFDAQAEVTGTGTDHNAYSGTAIVAGKGFKGGLTIGESDLRNIDSDSNFTDASKIHKTLDNDLLRPMGHLFDHEKSISVFDQNPEEYRPLNYLNIENVLNTTMSMFGINDQDRQRIAGKTAPIVKKVLKI